jgi:hypothetical protein
VPLYGELVEGDLLLEERNFARVVGGFVSAQHLDSSTPLGVCLLQPLDYEPDFAESNLGMVSVG